jgi:class 3 adenylate cyclase
VKITQDVRAFAMEQAGRRCECSGKNCRHHLSGARCKRGLRGDEWKVYWRSENGGATRGNIEAWCLPCFANNYEAPRETVALLASEIVGYAHLADEDERRAITLKSVLRDMAARAAEEYRGRLVFDRLDDDILAEFPTSKDAVNAVMSLCSRFREMVLRLDLPVPDLSGAIHCGEVTRWRNGLLAGEAVDLMASMRTIAGVGQIVLTEPAVGPVRGMVELEPVPVDSTPESPEFEGMWSMRL